MSFFVQQQSLCNNNKKKRYLVYINLQMLFVGFPAPPHEMY